MLYDYQEKISTTNYVDRIDDSGKPVSTYAPVISSRTTLFKTTEKEKDWWTKVTQYPVKASITVKGLLRPVILTTYVRLNVLYYGKKHISSGIYMITKQEDRVDGSGFTTTLNMVRVGTVSQDVI